jgi:HlyD family secretion protein
VRITSPSSPRSVRSVGTRRRGGTLVFTLAAISAAAGLALAGWFLFGRGSEADVPEFLTTTVWKGPYDFVVSEQGTVESGLNTELSCQVRARGGAITILDVVPEGTFVKEGDTVVELDASNLLLEENAQKIMVSTRESLLAQAENTLKAAEIAKTEYLEGLYVSLEKTALSDLYMAERAKATAETALESTKVLHTKNIVTAIQLESAYVMLEDANNKLDGARTNLNTLRNLTKEKESTRLEADIASAQANVMAQQQSLALEVKRLTEIQTQIAKCTIKATAAGEVVYVNETDSYRGSSQSQFIVAPGAAVRERQVIIWLPSADHMQVKARVNEAHVTLVRPGMPVSVRVDAFKDEMIEGEVVKVNQYAEPIGFSSGSIRKYATIIRIKNPPPKLRVGMNAEVRIHVERNPSAVQAPVQALAESQGHFFSLVKNGEEYVTREVKVHSTNDKVATIDGGLSEGDEIVLNPRSTHGLLKLPKLPDARHIAMSEIKRIDPRDATDRKLAKAAVGQRPEVHASPELTPAAVSSVEMTPADMIAECLQSDANRDDQLSREEIAKMDSRLRARLVTADADGDGFIQRRELQVVATHASPPVPKKTGGSNGAVPGNDGRRGDGDRTPATAASVGGGV